MSVAVFFEVLFHFEGGHAAGAGGGDGLAVAAILDVSAGEDSGEDLAVEAGEDVVVGEDVAVFVEVKRPLKALALGMWPMPRNMKETGRTDSSPETSSF